MLATALNTAKDQSGSESAARKAIEFRPDLPEGYLALISLQVGHGKSEIALATAREYASAHPGVAADLMDLVPRPPRLQYLAHQLAPRFLNEDFVVERARPIDRFDVAILTITAMAGAVAVAFNDREAVRFLQERPAVTSLSPWPQTVRVSCRRVESDFKALLAVATLGVGVAVLSHPHRLRTKIWPGPGVSAMAVGALAEIFMIAWHAHMISQGHYWLDRSLSYLIVFGTVARVQFRTTGAILGTWVVLALSGRWRPRSDLLDNLGCLLSFCWIGLQVLEHLAPGSGCRDDLCSQCSRVGTAQTARRAGDGTHQADTFDYIPLFLTSAHAADFIFTRQAEGEERARGLRWTDEDNVGQDDVSRTDINAAAGYGRSGPHGRQLDLAQFLAGRGVQSHQLAAPEGGEIDDIVGDGDAGRHRVADIFEDRLRRWTADGRHFGSLMAPVLLFRIQADGHDPPGRRRTVFCNRFLSPKLDGVDAVGVHALAIRGTAGLQAADGARQSQRAFIGRRVERVRRRAGVERRVGQDHAVRSPHDVKPAVLAAKPDHERLRPIPHDRENPGCVADRLVQVAAGLGVVGPHAGVPNVPAVDLRHPFLRAVAGIEAITAQA